MNYYELIKEYGANKGEKAMWVATKMVSDYIKPMNGSDPEGYWRLMKDTYAAMCGKHYNEEFAMWQIENMHFKDKKGEVHHAPHWTKSEYKSAYESMKSKLRNSNYNMWDFAVTIEMIYSDDYCLYKEWWPDASQEVIESKVVDAAINYLNDDDDTDGKIWKRFNG